MKVTDVFKTQGKPAYTYVSPTGGEYERMLKTSIENKGTLCLITGPSKTGKTTLVAKVAEQLRLDTISIRCDDSLTSEEFWKRALEGVSFERLTQRKNGKATNAEIEAKTSGAIGWTWLAKMSGEITTRFGKQRSEEEIREKILGKASANHMIPILKQLDALLVVEDFHYLKDEVKTTIFQQWKAFIDEEVSVVVIGTTHHACDLAYANKDLVGRISRIEFTTWIEADLRLILEKGCAALNLELPDHSINQITAESVGLPIITQAIALELLFQRKIDHKQTQLLKLEVNRNGLYDVLHSVAQTKYSQFELVYERMIAGLRAGTRRYKTYECMLSAFSPSDAGGVGRSE